MRARAEWDGQGGRDYCAACVATGTDCAGRCPYEVNAPRTADGAAAWRAAMGCMREGGVDVAAARRAAEDLGCAPEASADLVFEINAGFWAGHRKRDKGEGEG